METEINKENYKIFLKNNNLKNKDYSFNQYSEDLIKEKAKDLNFNARF